MAILLQKIEDDSPPAVWQYGWDFGIKGVFARIYQGSEFREKKWFKTVEEAATWLILMSKQKEETYRQELEKWQMKNNRKP